MLTSVITEGLIYGLMALGVFITFRILDFPDLTVDGTFPLGGAIYAFCLVNNVTGVLTVPLVFIGGFLAGSVTAFIHNKLKVPNLLAGILTMTMLYSVNLRIQAFKPNVSFLKYQTAFRSFHNKINSVFPNIDYALSTLLMVIGIVIIIKIVLDLFFHTDLGLTLGALGNNEQLVISQGVNPEVLKTLGVGLSNGLVAISGALAVQYQGSADVNLGRGIVVAGLASVMIGEFIFKSNKIVLLTIRVLLGSTIFRFLMLKAREALFLGLKPSDLQLIYGLFIILLLYLTQLREKGTFKKLFKGKSAKQRNAK